jgi:cysteine synthase
VFARPWTGSPREQADGTAQEHLDTVGGHAISGIEAIGGTPAVRLERVAGGDSAEVWVKLEGANPTGSYEDRMALAMIEGIFSGPSTGANLVAALRIAKRLGTGHRVVTLQVDSGLKYLAGRLYD